jgi:acyl-CoA thioesterase
VDASMPHVPGPDQCELIKEPFIAPFWDNFDMRLAAGRAWWKPDFRASDNARCARWIRYVVPQRAASGMIDPYSIPPIADLMPAALHQKLGPDTRFTAPSLDLTVHFLDHTASEWLLTDTHTRRARAGYATADVDIWDSAGRLVAYATQTMFLRQLPPR